MTTPQFPSTAGRTAIAAGLGADTPRKPPEAPGTAHLDSVRTIAETGVDLISIHSAPALGLTMLLTTGPVPCPR